MPQKIHAIYVFSPQISYDTKEQARTFDTLVLFVPYNEPYLQIIENPKVVMKGMSPQLREDKDGRNSLLNGRSDREPGASLNARY